MDPDLARRLIHEQAPGVAAASVELLGEGWDNTAYLVDGEWVFRFPRRQLGADLLAIEDGLLPRIAGRLPLPVPRPLYLGAPSEAFPWPFAGYRLLPGRVACRAGLSEEQRIGAAEPLGRFLAALHAIPLADLAGVPGDTLRRLDVAYRLPQTRERLDDAVAAGLLPSAEPWLPILDAPPADAPGGRCLVHGDLYACHLLVDDDAHLSGVIDWGDVHLNDPAADLMVLFAFIPPAARPAFRHAYGPISPDTERLARFRALFHTLSVLVYAHALGDTALMGEGSRAMEWLRS